MQYLMPQPNCAYSAQEALATDGAAPRGAALRRAAFNLLLFGCRQSGAAFIKWGQWASSRPDLLPEVQQHIELLCKQLQRLRSNRPLGLTMNKTFRGQT